MRFRSEIPIKVSGRGKQENGKWATLMRREQESFEMDNDVPFLIGTFAVSLVVVRTKSTTHLIFCVRVKGSIRNFDYYVNIRIINSYPVSKIYNALDD